jgi:hypothetical protein
MNQDLFQVLSLAKRHSWKYIISLDDAWFYFSNHFDQIYLPHDELPPSFPEPTIVGQQFMIPVVSNPHGFHVIQSLPKGI